MPGAAGRKAYAGAHERHGAAVAPGADARGLQAGPTLLAVTPVEQLELVSQQETPGRAARLKM